MAHAILLSGLVMTRARGNESVLEEPLPPLVYIPAPPNTRQPSRGRGIGASGRLSEQPPPTVPDLPHIDIEPGAGRMGPIVGGRVFIHFDSVAPTPPARNEPLSAMFVDLQVEMIPGQSPPRYPVLLERAGIEGDVVAQFIVDTLGRVEPASVNVHHATHAEFARAVRERLMTLRFVPARARGHVVRQLVEQRFRFEVVRR
ncbi:MAG TPA: TonB family protein [Gemmatimonadaceae bacterium]|nr:TonB family protein [Gemmatimonadaceae bacterium]